MNVVIKKNYYGSQCKVHLLYKIFAQHVGVSNIFSYFLNHLLILAG